MTLGMASFDLARDEEEIRGEPRYVSLETRALATEKSFRLSEASEYAPGRQLLSFRRYGGNGELLRHEAFEYSQAGLLIRVHVMDGSGTTIQTQEVIWQDTLETRITRDGSGEIVERTESKKDGAGRVLEYSSVAVSSKSRCTFRYDSEGEMAETIATVESGDETSQIARLTQSRAGKSTRVIYHGPTGTPLFSAEIHEDDERTRRMVVTTDTGVVQETIVRIVSMDDCGNWIDKAISKKGEASAWSEQDVELHRKISYY